MLLNENDRNCQNELINKINEAIKVLPGFSESLVMFKIERNNEQLQVTTGDSQRYIYFLSLSLSLSGFRVDITFYM